jgi:aminopeptidase N
LLSRQAKNSDGTRTDTWTMTLPHAPYLFFMGVGDFAIIKDSYKGKEVSYYVEKDQAQNARKIFGNTPEMMKFFSEKLGVEYPWGKYSQMVARDYVSGAMENTTATLHQESAYQNARQLADGNAWEETIAHELFHHWFGDLVTAESWSHITMNESFANYSEYLWDEYKYGKDFADAHHLEDMQAYLSGGNDKKDLVRVHYSNKEDVFDLVSYHKGGRILHMLRNYVGDDAFFKTLNLYLTTYKFKTGEAGQLRLAFEEVTGKDMNWFWNQWYYGSGHPKLKINYNYDVAGSAMVIVEQTQAGNLFQLPLAIDVYNGNAKTRHNVWMTNRTDTFSIPVSGKPDLINVDGDKILLAEKTDNKTEANYIAQWKNAKNFLDRREALEFFAKKTMPELARGLTDRSPELRKLTMERLAATSLKDDPGVLKDVEAIAKSDRDKTTKAAAISFLVNKGDEKYINIYKEAISDSSYSVAGAALTGLSSLDKKNSYALAKQYSKDAKGALGSVISDILISNGTEDDFEFISSAYDKAPPSYEKLTMTTKFGEYLTRMNDVSKIKKGIDYIIKFRNLIPAMYRDAVDPAFKATFDQISKAKGGEIAGYVKEMFK